MPSHPPPIHTTLVVLPVQASVHRVEENEAGWAEGMHEGRRSLGDDASWQRRGYGRGRGMTARRARGEGGTPPRSSRRIKARIAWGARPGFPSLLFEMMSSSGGEVGRERRRRRWREQPKWSNPEQLEGDANEEREAFAASHGATLLLLPPAAPSTVTRWASDVLSVPCQESGASASASHRRATGCARRLDLLMAQRAAFIRKAHFPESVTIRLDLRSLASTNHKFSQLYKTDRTFLNL
ncbi:hypothetical protein B0H13DRAFT_1867454 [Mycena leptocephala]|nr:hypothetical protein B0H13DRAFT_1867454 [Mycena leptocephala]